MILIEVLLSTLAALVVGAALLAMLMANMTSFNLAQGQGNADAQARQPLDILADNIRGAQPYNGIALQAAGSNALACYTDSAGDYSRFWLDTSTSALKETTGSVTTVLISGVQSLQFTYYVPSSGGAYTPVISSWATTANPSAPTTAELSEIGAIAVTASLSIQGYSRQFSTLVRLRNSPPGAPAW